MRAAAVAHGVAEEIGSGTRVLSTADADDAAVDRVDLLVENMRTKPGKGTPTDVSHPPVPTWLEALPAGAGTAAAFDTRVKGPFGSAAPAILKSLTGAGYRPVGKPTGFVVKGAQGPYARRGAGSGPQVGPRTGEGG